MGAVSVMTTETKLAFAERFVASPVPEAIIYIPWGCITLAVNKAHAERFPKTKPAMFDGGPLELVSFLRESKRRLGPSTSPADFCYCEAIKAVDVLALSDCSLVQLSKKADRAKAGITKLPDYILTSENGSRKYDVHGVLGRLIEEDILAVVPGSAFANIEVKNRTKNYIDLPKQGLVAEFNGNKSKIETGLVLNGSKEAYLRFLHELEEVEAMLEQHAIGKAKETLERLEEQFPIDRYAIRDVVGRILAPLRKSDVRDALAKLRQRGRSICDIFALREATKQKSAVVKEELRTVKPEHEFDVEFSSKRYVNGTDIEKLNGKQYVLDRLILLGDLTPSDVARFSAAHKASLKELVSAQMVTKKGSRGRFFLTMKGFAALRERNLTAQRQLIAAEAIALRAPQPKFRYDGVVHDEPCGDRQAVKLEIDGKPSIENFSAARLAKIGRSTPGSAVVYRFYESDEAAVSMIDPA